MSPKIGMTILRMAPYLQLMLFLTFLRPLTRLLILISSLSCASKSLSRLKWFKRYLSGHHQKVALYIATKKGFLRSFSRIYSRTSHFHKLPLQLSFVNNLKLVMYADNIVLSRPIAYLSDNNALQVKYSWSFLGLSQLV